MSKQSLGSPICESREETDEIGAKCITQTHHFLHQHGGAVQLGDAVLQEALRIVFLLGGDVNGVHVFELYEISSLLTIPSSLI